MDRQPSRNAPEWPTHLPDYMTLVNQSPRTRSLNAAALPQPFPEAQAPTSAIRSRPRPAPSSFLQRHRLRRRREDDNALSESISSVQDAVDRLNEASSNLGQLLDQPIPRVMAPDMYAEEYSGEAIVNRQRGVKRRKLDSQPFRQGFSYGYRGQVVPGPLKMSIVSCDGGHLAENQHNNHQTHYLPDNILRNDMSVYCTERSETSIILRHFVETPFCLTKIVIKAPASGFTAPVQEGMIFISMTSEDLLSRTAHYHPHSTSPPPPIHSTIHYRNQIIDNETQLPEEDPDAEPETQLNDHAAYLHNQDILRYRQWQATHPYNDRPPSRRTDYPIARPLFPPYNRPRLRPTHRQLVLESTDTTTPTPNQTDSNHASTHRRRTFPLPFRIETSCDDPSGDEEEVTEEIVMTDRTRRAHMIHLSSSSDDDDDVDRSSWTRRRVPRLTKPREIEWREDEAVAARGEGKEGEQVMLVPHATFFIEREKCAVSVKFDPPVSGKFILLKMWGLVQDKNIDIQSVIPYGFAGTRYFPAVKMM